MRADAVRNLDAVLRNGARLLADDPGASLSAIATEAGVDRRTVYRRFASRDSLLCAIYHAKLTAIEEALAEARLDDAPVPVALHRLVEGIVTAVRRYPVGLEQMRCVPDAWDRMQAHRAELGRFLGRAAKEGVLRDDLPEGMPLALLHEIIALVVRTYPELESGRATDLVVETLLGGIGRR